MGVSSSSAKVETLSADRTSLETRFDSDRSSEKPTAVIYSPGLAARGGAERLALRAAMACTAEGYETYVATDTDDISSISEYLACDSEGIRVLPLLGPRSQTRGIFHETASKARLWAQHARSIRALQPDLFINCKYKSELPGLGTRSLYYLHFPHHIRGTTRRLARLRQIAKRAAIALGVLSTGTLPWSDFRRGYDLFLANSGFTADIARRRWEVSADVVYPPCKLSYSVPNPLRARSIVTIGRFGPVGEHSPNKRHDVLIEAFNSSPLPELGWCLKIVGSLEEHHREYFESLTKMANLDQIILCPNLPRADLETILSECSVYWHAQGFGEDIDLYPEAQEHFGISIVEAMSAGVIPIVYRGGGPVELVNGTCAHTWKLVSELISRTTEIGSHSEPSLASCRDSLITRSGQFSDSSFEQALRSVIRIGEA